MITRHHHTDTTTSWATYSDCETYRYALCRIWEPQGSRVNFVMLNPSKATETANDPTVGRCEARAKALGHGAFQVTNLFSLRETDPHKMRKHSDPEGPWADEALRQAAQWADVTIAAWGVHGVHRNRNTAVLQMFAQAGLAVQSLGVTKAGHPRHPLYLPYSAQPQAFVMP